MKMIFIHANKTYFHKKVLHFARLVLKVRVLGTRKWPVYGFSRNPLETALLEIDFCFGYLRKVQLN